MLETIKLVAGTVADKDLVPAFTHIHIYNGRIQGMDGRAVAIDAECSELAGVHATVPASRFLKAANACDGEPTITVKDSKLTIKRLGFKATLPLMAAADYPITPPPPAGIAQTVNKGLVAALKRLKPFISDDASRPWSCSLLFKNNILYATNNVILVSLPFVSPINASFPISAIDEMIRVGQDPVAMMQQDNYIYFIYDKFWMRVLPSSLEWPDVQKMLDKFDYEQLPAVPGQLADAVTKIAHFHPDPKFPVVVFDAKGVHTMDGVHSASVEGIELPEARFRAEMIEKTLDEAIKADFTTYPSPCPFSGTGNLKGMIIGVRS